MASDNTVDWEQVKSQRSTTPDADRKHSPHCGSISLSPRGSSIHARIENAAYRCEGCNALTDACQDTDGGCDHPVPRGDSRRE